MRVFNISDLLKSKGSQLDIGKARIHAERAIVGIKNFRILNAAFPITTKDLLDNFFFNLRCYYNLVLPPLVPLWIKIKQEDLVPMVCSFLFNYRKPKWNKKKYLIFLKGARVWVVCKYNTILFDNWNRSLFIKQANRYN